MNLRIFSTIATIAMSTTIAGAAIARDTGDDDRNPAPRPAAVAPSDPAVNTAAASPRTPSMAGNGNAVRVGTASRTGLDSKTGWPPSLAAERWWKD